MYSFILLFLCNYLLLINYNKHLLKNNLNYNNND